MLGIILNKQRVEETLREYEAAHRKYMTTSVFTEEGAAAKLNMQAARDRYVAAVKADHPTWIVM